MYKYIIIITIYIVAAVGRKTELKEYMVSHIDLVYLSRYRPRKSTVSRITDQILNFASSE